MPLAEEVAFLDLSKLQWTLFQGPPVRLPTLVEQLTIPPSGLQPSARHHHDPDGASDGLIVHVGSPLPWCCLQAAPSTGPHGMPRSGTKALCDSRSLPEEV